MHRYPDTLTTGDTMKKLILALVLLLPVYAYALNTAYNWQYSQIVVQSGGITYYAKAPAGTSQSIAAWRCFEIDAMGDRLWFNGTSTFTCKPGISGNNLTSLTYSY